MVPSKTAALMAEWNNNYAVQDIKLMDEIGAMKPDTFFFTPFHVIPKCSKMHKCFLGFILGGNRRHNTLNEKQILVHRSSQSC